jgi:predicted MPP superfamily phosphohydrolase
MKSASTNSGVIMSMFLLALFFIYGGTHLYFFLKVKEVFTPGLTSSIFIALFLFLMVTTPVLVRVLENLGMETFARFIAYTGYFWMGFIFLFFTSSLAIDIYHLLLRCAGFFFHREFTALFLAKRAALILPVVLGIVISLYGYFEARDVRTERILIKTPKIPDTVGKFTIVQISDVHLGLIVREERLKRIIALVKGASPDLLVSTGDLVDGEIDRMTGLAELLRDIRPGSGKFAVTGNHEVYAGLGQAVGFTERAGFSVLRNEVSTAGGLINVAGVDDPVVGMVADSMPVPEKSILLKAPPDRFTLLLKHRPAVDPDSLGLFDLQLSGHVHKGQIFPFNMLTYLFYPVRTGFTLYSLNTALYVSRGTGTWGPPIRFLAPPEVTVIELIHDKL